MDADEIFELDLPPRQPEPPTEFKENPCIKVYLASALTGREGQDGSDGRIRKIIREVFEKAECLTPPYHVRYIVYDPADVTRPGTRHRPEEVYHIDFKKLVESDFALFFLNSPSYGVGVERQIAAIASVPVAWQCPDGNDVSRMFEGTFGESLFSITFRSEEELKLKLVNAIAHGGPRIFEKARRRRQIVEDLKSPKIPRSVFTRRIFLGVAIERVADETGISAYWFRELERDRDGIIAAATLTPILFHQLCRTLNGRWGFSSDGVPRFADAEDGKMGPVERISLENLYEAYVSRATITDDKIILRAWKKQVNATQQRGKTLLDEPVTAQEWVSRFQEEDKRQMAVALEVAYEKLSKIEKRSFDNLFAYCSSLQSNPNMKNVLSLWNTFQKDFKRRHRSAARKDALKPLSPEDWRDRFNKMPLDE